MDCDRFEATLIDELYDELDELTSAAAKRHVAGCSRCASLIGGLRATRRVAVVPIVEPSVDLEDRILAAARNAQRVVPIGRRFSRALSWAGSWAMRPQTAMAAVFVLMVGSSLLFVRRSKMGGVDSAMTVTAQGEPGPAGQTSTPADEPASLDSKQAAAAHGLPPPPPAAAATAAPVAAVAASASAAPAFDDRTLAFKESKDGERARAVPGGAKSETSSLEASEQEKGRAGGPVALNAGPIAGAPYATSPAAAAPKARAPYHSATPDEFLPSDLDKASVTAGGGQASNVPASPPANEPSTLLQAAREQKNTAGCGAYDHVPWGTTDGYKATWEAAECYRMNGQADQARTKYQALLAVPAYVNQARDRIASMSPSTQQTQIAVKAPARKAAPAPAKPSAVATQASATSTAQAAPAAPPPQATPPAQVDDAPARKEKAY